MGYLGLRTYDPESFHEIESFYLHSCEIFGNVIHHKLNSYRAAFNQDDEFGEDCPIILFIGEIALEISTKQDEDISLTTNSVDLNEKIIWLEDDDWKWRSEGLEILDKLIGYTLDSVSVVGLDYNDLGIAIHGILLILKNESSQFELLIRSNYDKITILELKDDEPKVFVKCY